MSDTNGATIEDVQRRVDDVYRAESRRVFATLIRMLGDFDLAEEAMHDAFAAAVEQWPREGIPANPRAWLVSAGRFKAIDVIRRRARFDASLAERTSAALPLSRYTQTPPGAGKWRAHADAIERVMPRVEATWRRLQALGGQSPKR